MMRLLAIMGLAGSLTLATDAVDPLAIALAIVLLCGSAFFSGSETALFSLQVLDRNRLRERGITRVDALLDRPRQTLATILIGNELNNVALSTVTAAIVLKLVPSAPWLNIVLLTPLLLIMGEVVPKVTALKHATRIAPLIARPLQWVGIGVTPIRWFLSWVANGLVRLTGGSEASVGLDLREEQLKEMIREGRRCGSIEPLEQEMLDGVLAFGELSLSRLMTPRTDVFSLSLSTPWNEILKAIRTARHSRIPVWQGSPESLVGVLVVKDLLPLVAQVQRGARPLPGAREIQRLLHPLRFVPTTKKAEDMLREFRTEHFHMAMVVEEHGMMMGLVTLDDLLGELVGELLDERDDETQEMVEIQNGLYKVRASMDVEDFNKQFHQLLPMGEYTTVGGFLLHILGEVPAKGTEVQWEGFRFVVTGMEAQRLTEICVHSPEAMAMEGKG